MDIKIQLCPSDKKLREKKKVVTVGHNPTIAGSCSRPPHSEGVESPHQNRGGRERVTPSVRLWFAAKHTDLRDGCKQALSKGLARKHTDLRGGYTPSDRGDHDPPWVARSTTQLWLGFATHDHHHG
jgi:hypothetical protein